MTDGTALHVSPRRMRGAVDQADLAQITRLLDVSGRTAAGAAYALFQPGATVARRSQGGEAAARRLRA